MNFRLEFPNGISEWNFRISEFPNGISEFPNGISDLNSTYKL